MTSITLRRIRCGACVFVIFILSGCGSYYSESSSNPPPPPSIPPQFVYATHGSCEAGDLSFQYLEGSAILPWSDPSQITVVHSQLYLQESGRFDLVYREFESNTLSFQTQIDGLYTVNSSAETLLIDLGRGGLIHLPHGAALEVTFSKALNNPLLLDRKLIFRPTTSDKGLGRSRSDCFEEPVQIGSERFSEAAKLSR